jgi:hypothetical protein
MPIAARARQGTKNHRYAKFYGCCVYWQYKLESGVAAGCPKKRKEFWRLRGLGENFLEGVNPGGAAASTPSQQVHSRVSGGGSLLKLMTRPCAVNPISGLRMHPRRP